MNGALSGHEIDGQIDQLIADLQNYDVFPFYLRICMERKEMSQSNLARAIHVTPAAVNQWLSSVRLPSLAQVALLAKALKLSQQEARNLHAALTVHRIIKDQVEFLKAARDLGTSVWALDTVRPFIAAIGSQYTPEFFEEAHD